jgi:hypothetical protein
MASLVPRCARRGLAFANHPKTRQQILIAFNINFGGPSVTLVKGFIVDDLVSMFSQTQFMPKQLGQFLSVY